jgi:hypothetical protein
MSPKEIHKKSGKPFFWGRLTAAEKDERDRLHPGMYAAPIAGPSTHVPSPRGGHGVGTEEPSDNGERDTSS